MGFDCGFGLHPRLELNAENIQAYKRFIEEVRNTYSYLYDDKGRREDGKILELTDTSIQWSRKAEPRPAVTATIVEHLPTSLHATTAAPLHFDKRLLVP
jgi:hypothetical protein